MLAPPGGLVPPPTRYWKHTVPAVTYTRDRKAHQDVKPLANEYLVTESQ